MGLIEIEKIKWRKMHILLAKWNTSRSKINNSNEQDFLHIEDAHNFISTAVGEYILTHTHTNSWLHSPDIMPTLTAWAKTITSHSFQYRVSSRLSFGYCILYSLIWCSQYAVRILHLSWNWRSENFALGPRT